MIKRIFGLATIILFFAAVNLSGQQYKEMMHDPQYNIYDVMAEAEAYFENRDKGKGSGWKGYQRWKSYVEPLYYPSGDRSQADPYLASKVYEQFVKRNQTYRSTGGDSWIDLGPYTADSISTHYSPGIGRVEEVYVDPNDDQFILMGSRSGGFWKSTDGGNTWINTTDQLFASGVNEIAVDPNNRNHILINVRNAQNGTSHGIYRSMDEGLTWSPTLFIPENVGQGGLGTNWWIDDLHFSPYEEDVIFIASKSGIYKSTDNLDTWTLVATGEYGQIEFHPTSADTIYAYRTYYWDRNKVYRSTNGGNSFSQIVDLGSANDYSRGWIGVSDDDPDVLYFASGKGVWKSNDGGDNFTFIANNDTGGACFGVSDTDADRLLKGGIDAYLSIDGGQTMTQVSDWYLPNASPEEYVHADLRAIICVNGDFYMGTDGYVVKSLDGGSTWEIISNGTGIRENYRLGVSQSDNTITVCGSQDNGTSIYRGDIWLEWVGADGMEGLVHPLNADYILGSIQNGNKRRTTSGGYNQQSINGTASGNFDWIAPLVYNPMNHMTIYSLGNALHKSETFGGNWQQLHDFGINGMDHMAIAENNGDLMFFSVGSRLFKSTNGGTTATEIFSGTLPNHTINDIAFDPKDDQTIVLCYGQHQDNNSRLFISHDEGVTWNNISYNLSAMPARSVVIDHTPEKNIYVGGEIGVYTMPMNGTQYTLLGSGFPNVTSRELDIMWGSNTLRAATWGRGLWEHPLVGRDSFVQIVQVNTTQTITPETPTQGSPLYASAIIEGTVSDAWIDFSVNGIQLDQTLDLLSLPDGRFISEDVLPTANAGDNVYFKVYAVSVQGDTTESYRYMYKVQAGGAYCAAAGDQGTGSDYINEVSLNGITNSSGQDYYGDFTNIIIPAETNQTYTIDVSLAYHWEPDTVYAWIDFNNNQTFEDQEIIYFSMLDANHDAFGTFTVPDEAFIGKVRMRVRSMYWNSSPNPCGTATGEVEDYLVDITKGCTKNAIVNNTNDDGHLSLRKLMAEVCPNDTIYIDVSLASDTLTLSSGSLLVDGRQAIVNVGHAPFVLSGDDIYNVFIVDDTDSLYLEDLHLMHGYDLNHGGAIHNMGSLTLKNVHFKENSEGDPPSAIGLRNDGEVIILEGETEIKQEE